MDFAGKWTPNIQKTNEIVDTKKVIGLPEWCGYTTRVARFGRNLKTQMRVSKLRLRADVGGWGQQMDER